MDHLSEQNLDRLMTRPTECCDERYSIQDKIGLAQDLYANWGDVLLTDPYIKDLLEKLDGSIEASRKVMLELNIVETCKRCDEEEGGSCCGASMENKFDTILLLINLLLGVSLPTDHRRPESCYLLSARGCLLKVRLVLCVDFLCPKIISALRRDELIRLQQISGEELVTGFMLYDAIKKFLRKSASTNQP